MTPKSCHTRGIKIFTACLGVAFLIGWTILATPDVSAKPGGPSAGGSIRNASKTHSGRGTPAKAGPSAGSRRRAF